MAASLHLGLDVGTQGTKALLLDVERGAVVGRGAVSYELLPGLPPGAAEQWPQTWLVAAAAATHAALASCGAAAADVAALAVSGQQHGLVVLDERGAVIRPAKLWCDTTTAAEAEELSAALGRRIPAGFTAPKLLWLKRHEPVHFARVRSVHLPHDYVNRCLTGVAAMEAGDASGTGWLDVARRAWDERALAATDARLREWLPATLLAPGAPAGELTADGARLLSLRAGTLVAAGSGDNMLSALGAGATRPGVVVASLGTSGTAFAHLPAPRVDPRGLIAGFCDATGGGLPLLCVMNMTGVVEQVRALLGRSHDELAAAAEAVAPGCDGLLLAPYLQGERVPDLPHATGALLGLRTGLLEPGRLYRAALEGTAVHFARGVAELRRVGIAPTVVRLVGGGARSSLWRQILAAALAVPVVPLRELESAALGAALQSLWCARGGGGGTAAVDALVAPFVHADAAPIEPDPAWVAVARAASQRLGEWTERTFGRAASA